MLWMLASMFFFWCAFREVRGSFVPRAGYDFPTPITPAYLLLVLALGIGCAWSPVRIWQFERFLSAQSTELAEGHVAHVHCNTAFDTMVDPASLAAGHARSDTGEIAFQAPWCSVLMSYLRHPGRADREELFSLSMFTHEAMHIRGEHDEARTECQAVQRSYRAARLLGVPEDVARQNARDVYTLYQGRASGGSLQQQYYSAQCAPGLSLDEHLSDSSWAPP
jgi:hypothetical protein